MNYSESTFVFNCREDYLVGILTEPNQATATTGVIIVVGGPQYRAGSHRQFVHLSRELATAGIPCMRFDCRGMGDSTGYSRDFTAIGDDIRAAVDTFLKRAPSIKRFVLWGLCDGATAATFYAAEDHRISGLVLLNPWVHTERAEARVFLKHYYLRRLVSNAFWRKVLQGHFDFTKSISGLWKMVGKILPGRHASSEDSQTIRLPLPDRFVRALTRRPIKIFFVLSEMDFVANEFENLVRDNDRLHRLIKSAEVLKLSGADHTFSDSSDTTRVSLVTIEWVQSH